MTAHSSPAGATMAGMTAAPAHAKPVPRRDHLWVLVIVAGCALIAVWGSWLEIGDKSGFAPLGHLGTGWTPAVIVEAYWAYAMYAWLAAAPGPRSRRFAMWSFFAMFTLSLIGQASSHLTAHRNPPAPVVVFMSDLPVIVVACIAVLIHLRQLDRTEAEEAGRAQREAGRQAAQASAEAGRIAELEAALATERGTLEPLRADLETARDELARVTAKAEVLAQKLARISGRKPARKSPPKKAPASTPNKAASSTPETEVPEDVDTQAAALEILAHEPDISGSELGRRLGRTERYGCMLKKSLAATAAPSSAPGEN